MATDAPKAARHAAPPEGAPISAMRAKFLRLIEVMSQAAPPEKRQEFGSGEVLQLSTDLDQFFRTPHLALPKDYAAQLNTLGTHTEALASIHEPNDLSAVIHWPRCGCYARVSPLCKMALDHRAEAKFQEETAKGPPKTLKDFIDQTGAEKERAA